MRDLPGGGGLFAVTRALSAVSAVAASVLMFVGLALLSRRRNWRLLLLLGLPIVYCLLLGSGLESYSRFRLQMFPGMIAAASIAVIALYDRAQARLGAPATTSRVGERKL
jgi:hypothetical protein